MHYDIINDFLWCHHQPPVKIQIPFTAAAAPAFLLIFNRNSLEAFFHLTCKIQDSLLYIDFRLLDIPIT